MEEIINCNEKLTYCLDKINMLISKVDKFNTTVRLARKNADILKISKTNVELIDIEELTILRDYFCALIENSYSKEEDIEKAKIDLENTTIILENEIENEIKKIENIQNEEIYRKAV